MKTEKWLLLDEDIREMNKYKVELIVTCECGRSYHHFFIFPQYKYKEFHTSMKECAFCEVRR